MTGSLTLSGAPSNTLHAATKAYVDGLIPSGAMTTYTPTWTGGSPTIGNGVLVGKYFRFGTKMCYFQVFLSFGTTTNGSSGTPYAFALPFTAVTNASAAEQVVLAKAFTTVGNFVGTGYIPSASTTVAPFFPGSVTASNTGGTFNSTDGNPGNGSPLAAAAYTYTSVAGNIVIQGVYEVA